jgi:hypothetical protein
MTSPQEIHHQGTKEEAENGFLGALGGCFFLSVLLLSHRAANGKLDAPGWNLLIRFRVADLQAQQLSLLKAQRCVEEKRYRHFLLVLGVDLDFLRLPISQDGAPFP